MHRLPRGRRLWRFPTPWKPCKGWRQPIAGRSPVPLWASRGSNGKTLVKEMLASHFVAGAKNLPFSLVI